MPVLGQTYHICLHLWLAKQQDANFPNDMNLSIFHFCYVYIYHLLFMYGCSWLKEATQTARSSNTPNILGFGKGCNFSLIKGLESSPEGSWSTRKLKRCHEQPALRDLKQQDGEGALRYLNVLCPFNKAGTLFSRSLFREWRWVRFVKKRILGKEKSHDPQVTVGRRDDRCERPPGSSSSSF